MKEVAKSQEEIIEDQSANILDLSKKLKEKDREFYKQTLDLENKGYSLVRILKARDLEQGRLEELESQNKILYETINKIWSISASIMVNEVSDIDNNVD